MADEIRISKPVEEALRCPVCHAGLHRSAGGFSCDNPACAKAYPIVNGIPVILNEERSIFEIASFTGREAVTTFRPQPRIEKFFSRVLPEITANFASVENYRKLKTLVAELPRKPRILVVGCGEVGRGMDEFVRESGVELINTDVSMSERADIICDSHDLPFVDGFFDGVIVQAVLEHVADPPRCVEEIFRVMADHAVIYAETPFMQQVHGGPFDFTRYTDVGHRRLFRRFEEISSGPTAGSALALAWSFQYFLLSFVRSSGGRAVMKAISRISLFWLKYVDRWLLRRPGTNDAALGYFFLGRKSDKILSDREIIKHYRGGGLLLPSPA
jgi:ubiquinone/menaquinone biosynthesis C-methylase UbiE/uncharacterized protein YbaR (Trm112 family)